MSDALEGVTRSKRRPQPGSGVTVKVEKSETQLKDKLKNLIESYNATRFALSEISIRFN